jgi:hypothetical protein
MSSRKLSRSKRSLNRRTFDLPVSECLKTLNFMKEELRQDILAHSSSYITSKWIIERIPYVFSNDMHSYISWKSELSSRIEVDGRAISVVGSSAVGCSLSPDKPLREFSKDSDIDIAMVSV